MWVLPVPLGPSAMTFSRRSIHSHRASSSTSVRVFSRTDRVHTLTVELQDRPEVEAVQALLGRELRSLDAALDHPSLAVDQLQLDQAGQELDVIQPFGGTLAGQLLVLPQEGGELQRLQVMGKQDLRSIGHAASPDSSAM